MPYLIIILNKKGTDHGFRASEVNSLSKCATCSLQQHFARAGQVLRYYIHFPLTALLTVE